MSNGRDVQRGGSYNRYLYTEEEIRRLNRKRKWRRLKHKLIDLGLVLLMLLMVVAFVLLAYVLASISSKTTINYSTITVGTMTREEFEPVKTMVFGYDVTKYGEISDDIYDFNSIGEYTVKYKPFLERRVRDIKISIVDDVTPVLTLMGDAIIYVPNIDDFVEPGYVCYDNYDVDIQSKVVVEREQPKLGEYHIKYSVSDSSGNEANAERIVYVDDMTTVYLTFDDGPDGEVTPQILDILDRFGVQATFFVLGLDSDGEAMVAYELQQGHTVGLHGYSHEYSQIYTSVDAIMDNFYRVEEQVRNLSGGYDSKIIRFPGGSSNTVSKNYCYGVMTEATERAQQEGYHYFDWNIDSGDSGDARNDARAIYLNVISSIRLYNTNVVLLHDGPGHQATADALEDIIRYCIDHEYSLRAINYQTVPVQHGVSN